jgi:hypothetical protein
MSHTDTSSITPPASPWKSYEKIAFRLFFIYFLLQAVPLDWKFYRELFSTDWTHLHYGALFNLAHYTPRWSAGSDDTSPGIQTYADWGILLSIAILGAAVWTYIDNRRQQTATLSRRNASLSVRNASPNYDTAYYWIRVIVRYRLAIGIIAYGFLKLFPLQAPYPSLSNLNTNYGDFTRWKIFSLSLGIVPSYESFLGLVEIIGGLLLFYRRSASIGAFIILIFLGNVFMSNLAYGGGDQVYSLYLISLALFILSYDVLRLADLLIFQRPAVPNRFQLVLSEKWQRTARLALKTAVIFFFVVFYGFKTRSGYQKDPYQFPVTKGLDGASGIYNVTLFRINKDTLAYSKTDPVRWQDVVFENWATLSIRSNRPVVLDSNNIERPELRGNDRAYELEGSAGRHYYSYITDTVNHLLTLQNKNPHYSGEKWILHYERPGAARIVLSGAGPNKDSVYVVLDRIDKKYLLEEAGKKGRLGGLKL